MTIGVYDSGVGGLSVWRELRSRVSGHLIYFGDTAHVPFGEKTPEQLSRYFADSLAFFESRGCNSVVVACNTTSAAVLPRIRHLVKLPLIDMIEGAKRAAAAARVKRLGVIATKATVNSGVYQRALEESLPGSRVFMQAAPELVPLVEAGEITGPRVKRALEKYLEPLLAEEIDGLLLGCTHYPFLEEPLTELLAGRAVLIDPALAVTRLALEAWPQVQGSGATTEFWVSSDPEKFEAAAKLILMEELPPVNLRRPPEEDIR